LKNPISYNRNKPDLIPEGFRKTTQFLLPEYKPAQAEGNYDIYPSFHLPDNLIYTGYEALAGAFLEHHVIIIDGYQGIFFEDFIRRISLILGNHGKKVKLVNISDHLKSPSVIDELISPSVGNNDQQFGKKSDLMLEDFFDLSRIRRIKPDDQSGINIIAGPGAALSGWHGLLVCVDIPKNEIQFRARAGSVTNLGSPLSSDPKEMYRRSYFVDWNVLNRHKEKIIRNIDIFVDGQRHDSPVWISGEVFRMAMGAISKNLLRVRPWFEPGVWGGTWIRDNIPGLNKETQNYAWSFELISPENGILLESSEKLLEASFDTLMYLEGRSVLGDCYDRFLNEFPIRFDFLDTIDGGNLSIQCHPRPEYIKEHFGENFTQEETYYILDSREDSVVFLGFTNNIDPEKFRNKLEKSISGSKPVKIEKFVQRHRSKKHDMFLIPYGTIHGSGKNNLVLEISSTPYIFTFKLYDWLRPDLDGKPRPLNIKRGMDNLYFDRKGDYVNQKLISHAVLTGKGDGWELWHLPTHETHLYDVHRYRISKSVSIKTEDKCHVLNAVEGSSIIVKTKNGMRQVINYAETFIIPAAAESYTIINSSDKEVMVVKAFVK